ncbi:hypothetical protein IRZ71_18995 [Flavobacterium sp. ANB]|uniref:hypothetical protein n=1 Tax=unclassified Flavobacterium TaxID=196869 RepID=UPI0012B9C0A3|nr:MULTISPECIES: hypothetical protein [unclassified Flavobacterium]MBF4518448.1 hypothetical protein [Flavobacterium sp. ANB]MTD70858.1 hypothetical protein [Flavobacterium sp. LC2016-13]
MKNIIILILVLFSCLKVHGQGGETKWIKPPVFNFNIAEVVYEEAEKQNIDTDCIIIIFNIDEKCQIHDFTVSQGKLKSFTEWAKKDSDIIIREWLRNYPCDSKKRSVKLPIKINLKNF